MGLYNIVIDTTWRTLQSNAQLTSTCELVVLEQ